MMNSNGKMEIIVREGESSRSIRFEELFSLRNSLDSLMFLWDFNSYFVDVGKSLFIVNGGRRTSFPKLKSPVLVYRKRTSCIASAETEREEVSWIMGLQADKDMVLLVISKDGASWRWSDRL